MSKAQHTPGPWRTEEAGEGKWIQVYGNGAEPHQNIAEVRRDDFISVDEDGDEPTANARLIAAAPDMKELLEEIHHAEVFFQSACIARDFADADKWERTRKEALAKIPAAIARATGKE